MSLCDSADPPRRRRKEARPQELTAAALELFTERGFAATRLEDIAARAGVSKGTLYLYFDSKEALFEAVIREGIIPAMNEGRTMLEEHQGSASELLRCLLLGWWELLGESPLGGVPKLMVSEAGNFPKVAAFYRENVIDPGRALLREALQRGMDQGEFRPVDVGMAVDVIFAPILMLAVWRYSIGPCCAEEERDPVRFLDTHFDLLIKGLRP
ncbi:TetR/AcrR family transcriptional regulator [Azospira sp. APE16]|jgi:AcrR family transcriptional regulator|uniref:Transcriptional regulator n=2 Tax=Azospira oryzae TaxID=146939 RepID=G8QP25_AZOOP|nr:MULTISPECIES: TetR/AcrR family transcriptional regulator [Azospira]TLS19862.1 MAG: TetR/AcrR family transcriptional regulator [Betaproteobacteria bacterium]AEV24824.1 transcriptional regulator [Azospira oryzae PS]MBP7489527.1 TetR/AcrR family transcriptional regulator [Azospira sp.]RZT76837.1 TetR family transcriptional regulator [Azospira oryzae]BBN88971.1 TetR family transcriptional regulator [Azospira sp. I09]